MSERAPKRDRYYRGGLPHHIKLPDDETTISDPSSGHVDSAADTARWETGGDETLASARSGAPLLIIAVILSLSIGGTIGFVIAQSESEQNAGELPSLRAELQKSRREVATLRRTLGYRQTAAAETSIVRPNDGSLARIAPGAKRYAAALTRARHKRGGELVLWFAERWESLLRDARAGDLQGRRADLLVQFFSAVKANIHPGDFVDWQLEMLSQPWLPELSFDANADGLPAARRDETKTNLRFERASICNAAMALNQLSTAARAVLMPGLRCDDDRARITLKTVDNASTDDLFSAFAAAVVQRGLAVVDKTSSGTRILLIGDLPD